MPAAASSLGGFEAVQKARGARPPSPFPKDSTRSLMDVLTQTAGFLTIALAAFDIYRTVLSSNDSRGPIESSLSRGVWAVFRSIGKRTGAQPKLAEACGPVLVATLLALWSAFLILGFALVYWPRLEIDVGSSSHSSIRSFDYALYFSGFTLTTLGVGDLYPTSGWTRILTVIQAWLGFSMLTLSVSYILSVYQAVRQDNALATSLDALSGGTGSSVELFKRLQPPAEIATIMNELRVSIVQLYTAHQQYPVIHYFQRSDLKYSVVRMFFLALDYTSLRLSTPEHRADPTTRALEVVLQETLMGFKEMMLPKKSASEARDSGLREAAWRQHAREALSAIEVEALKKRPELDVNRYVSRRASWEGKLRSIADYLDVDWELATYPDSRS